MTYLETMMRIKDDIIEKWENGWTVYDIAEFYYTPVENVTAILGLTDAGYVV